MPRLYNPTAGRILIDGYDISKLQLGSVRRQIGIVPQDSLLFDGTVRDNISLTAPNATAEEIVPPPELLVPTISLWNFLMDMLLVLESAEVAFRVGKGNV